MNIKGGYALRVALLSAGCLAASRGTASEARIVYDAAESEHYNGMSETLTGERAQGDDFRVVLKGEVGVDTAWRVVSKRIAVEPGAAYASFDFDIYSDADWRTKMHNSAPWNCGLTWYDAKGTAVKAPPWVDALGVRHEAEYFNPQFLPGRFSRFRIVSEVPAAAASVVIGFGRDVPNLGKGERVSVRNSTATFHPAGAARPRAISPDLKGPIVSIAFASPTCDAHVSARFRVADETGVDWASLKVFRLGTKETYPYAREGDMVTVRPGKEWASGDHHLLFCLRDTVGNKTEMAKAFRIGDGPSVPGTRLREDGVLLVGGKPVFPVGLFGVCPREANLYSLDRAFAELKSVGVNLAHSYTHYRTPEFSAGCRKHGIVSFQAEHSASYGSKWFRESARQDPSIALWYVGDDTAMHYEPETIKNRVEGLQALDGTRLTCHADVYSSRFGEYADLVDVFMPEIYPIFGRAEDDACVARTIDVMEKSLADIRTHATGKPRAVWPIIQHFKGYTAWKRMPTPEEVYAMSFAALIHGGKGITWYTYGAFVEPEKNKFNYGVCSSAETWNATTNLTRRISLLSPVLMSADVPQPAAPEILEGEPLDAMGRPSVTVLLKRHEQSLFLFAVNARKERVRARLSTGDETSGRGSVMCESREVAAAGGRFEDVFEPFAVHIYRFAAK